MPHECVSCGHVLEDGSDEVLEGCPECEGTTFSYVADVSDTPETISSPDSPTEPTEPTEPEEDDSDILEAESSYERAFGGKLDNGTEAEEPQSGDDEAEIKEISEEESPPTSAAEEARRELMDQFETIRIVEPGSYELNLMNLYEEDQKIIALQEDGRYQVTLPSGFDD